MKKLILGLSILIPFVFLSCGGDSSDELKVNCDNTTLEVFVDDIALATCEANGSITLSSTGGEGAVTYSIDGVNFQSNPVFSVAAGNYTARAKDTQGCIKTVPALVGVEAGGISIDNISSTESGCGTSNSTITVTASGGSATLMYSLNNGTAQESNVFTDISAGTYSIVVDDGTCESSQNHKVLAGTSLSEEIMPLLAANCAVSGCHNGDNGASRNWTVKSNVLSSGSEIKSRTQAGSMPPPGSGRSITEEQKALIACWVDDGALDN